MTGSSMTEGGTAITCWKMTARQQGEANYGRLLAQAITQH